MAFRGAEGQGGELRAGGRVVARLGRWTAHRDRAADTWTIVAPLVEAVDLWLDGPGPFEVRLRLGAGVWRWREVAVSRDGGHLTIVARQRFERLSA